MNKFEQEKIKSFDVSQAVIFKRFGRNVYEMNQIPLITSNNSTILWRALWVTILYFFVILVNLIFLSMQYSNLNIVGQISMYMLLIPFVTSLLLVYIYADMIDKQESSHYTMF